LAYCEGLGVGESFVTTAIVVTAATSAAATIPTEAAVPNPKRLKPACESACGDWAAEGVTVAVAVCPAITDIVGLTPITCPDEPSASMM
jgi:hypothetical protein